MPKKDKSGARLNKEDLMARIAELHGSGKSWHYIAAAINADGFLNEDGHPFKAKSLETKHRRWTRAQEKKAMGHTESDIDLTVETSPTPPTKIDPTIIADTISETVPTSSSEIGEISLVCPSEACTVSPTNLSETALTSEMQDLIRSFMEKERARILAGGIEVTEVQKSGRAGHSLTTKKSFSIPLDLWNEFESRFRGSILSNHVAAALRVYLNVTRGKSNMEADKEDSEKA